MYVSDYIYQITHNIRLYCHIEITISLKFEQKIT